MNTESARTHFENLVAALPGAKGGILSPDGDVLCTNDVAVLDAVREKYNILEIIDKGALPFVPIMIEGKMYNPINGKQAFDDIVILNGYLGGGVVALFERHLVVVFSTDVSEEELNTKWQDIMKDRNEALKASLDA